jgi:hypothetical protein
MFAHHAYPYLILTDCIFRGFEHQALIEQNSALEVGLLARRGTTSTALELSYVIYY